MAELICNQNNDERGTLPQTQFSGNAVILFRQNSGLPSSPIEADISYTGAVTDVNINLTGNTTTGTPVISDNQTLNIVGTTGQISTVATTSGAIRTLTVSAGANVPLLNAANVFTGNNTFGDAPADTLTVVSASTFNQPINFVTDAQTGNTVTANTPTGRITTATLTTASNVTQAIVINNTFAEVGDIVEAKIESYSGTYFTNGLPTIINSRVSAAGVITVNIANNSLNALNGTVVFTFVVFKT